MAKKKNNVVRSSWGELNNEVNRQNKARNDSARGKKSSATSKPASGSSSRTTPSGYRAGGRVANGGAQNHRDVQRNSNNVQLGQQTHHSRAITNAFNTGYSKANGTRNSVKDTFAQNRGNRQTSTRGGAVPRLSQQTRDQANDQLKNLGKRHAENLKASAEGYGANKDKFYQKHSQNYLESTGKDKTYQNVDRDKLEQYGGSYDKLRVKSTDTSQMQKEYEKDVRTAKASQDTREKIKNQSDSAISRFLWDAEGTGTEMALDQLSNPIPGATPVKSAARFMKTPVRSMLENPLQASTLGTMAERVWGQGYSSAKEEGANERQAELYGLGSAATELGTELMFGMGGRLMAGYGGGLGDDVVERALNVLANKMTNGVGPEGLKNLTYSAINHLAPMITEGLEEGVADVIDPRIANLIYANAVAEQTGDDSVRHQFSLSDMAYDMALGGFLGGMSGTSLALQNNARGQQIKDIYGPDGMLTLANKVAEVDEDIDTNRNAEVIIEQIRNGKPIANGQAVELMNMVQEQSDVNMQNYRNSMIAAEDEMRSQGLSNPYMVMGQDENGNPVVNMSEHVAEEQKNNQRLASESLSQVLSERKSEGGTSYQIDDKGISNAISEVLSGSVRREDDINVFNVRNTEAREALERAVTELTGSEYKLPETNKETRAELFRLNAEMLTRMAAIDKVKTVDQLKGLAINEGRYGTETTRAYHEILDNIDDLDTDTARMIMKTFKDYARAGALGLEKSDVDAINHPVHQSLSDEDKEMIYNASVRDNGSESLLEGVVTDTSKTIEETAREMQKQGKTVTGGVVVDPSVGTLPQSKRRMLDEVGRTLNVKIHVVTKAWMLENGDTTEEQRQSSKAPNGYYSESTGEIFYAIDSTKPLEFVIGHETLHHLKAYAPSEYKKMKRLFVQQMGESDPNRLDNMIKSRQALYKANGQTLSKEGALEEIMADQMYEILQSPSFWEKVEKEKPSLAKACVDAIRDMLDRIRRILTNENKFKPEDVRALYDSLGILGSMEDLALAAYKKASENALAVGEAKSEKTKMSAEPDIEQIKSKKRKSQKDRIALRDAGEKLSEKDFYELYRSTHTVGLRYDRNDTEGVRSDVEGILRDGFRGTAGYGVNLSPLIRRGENYIESESQLREERGMTSEDIEKLKNHTLNIGTGYEFVDGKLYTNVSMGKRNFRIEPGQTVMLVPENYVNTKGGTYGVKPGFKPFEYEILEATDYYQDTLYDLYSDAYDKWNESNKSSEESFNSDLMGVDAENGVRDINGVADRVKFNLASADTVRDELEKSWNDKISKAKGKKRDKLVEDKESALTMYDSMRSLAESLEQDEAEYPNFKGWNMVVPKTNREGKAVGSVIVTNGEYSMNIDFSTICKKRRALDRLLFQLSKEGMFDTDVLEGVTIVELNEVLAEHGYEVSCPLCFVDTKRYAIYNWADSFSTYWNGVINLLTKDTGVNASDFNFLNRNNVYNEENPADQADDSKLNMDILDTIINYDGKITEPEFDVFKDDKGNMKGIVKAMAKAIKGKPDLRKKMTAADILASPGQEAVRSYDPELFTILNGHMGSAKPKNSYTDTPSTGEILASSWTPEKAFEVGGVRIQSFSDYIGYMFFDYVQTVAELEAKGLPVHGYTKEADFVRIFGKTGIKINMSLVPKVDITDEERERYDSYLNKDGSPMKTVLNDAEKNADYEYLKAKFERAGLDENGNYLWADESFGQNGGQEGFDLAVELLHHDDYHKNVGTIAVGVSDAHIRKLLNDPNISQVIPYHASGINKKVAIKNNIDKFKDFTKHQNDTVGSEEHAAKLKARAEQMVKDGSLSKSNFKKLSFKAGNSMSKFYNFGVEEHFDFYESMQKNNYDAKKVAKEYLADCDKKGIAPVFSQFRDEPGYYKMIIDFNSYDRDGNVSPQTAVKSEYPDNVSEYVKASVKLSEKDAARLNSDNEDFKAMLEEARNVVKPNEGNDVKFSLVEDGDTLAMLNDAEESGDTVETYRAMVLIDGKLYPPMASKMKNKEGKIELAESVDLDSWYQADEFPASEYPELYDKDGKFLLRKDKGTPVPAAYNPYIHSSLSPLNDQFSAAWQRPNMVVVKGIVPKSELTSGYRAEGAKNAVGSTTGWNSGPVAKKLSKVGKPRVVILSRWFKPIEVMSDEEVAKVIKNDIMGDTQFDVPYNVVTPSLRSALENEGINIVDSNDSRLPSYSDVKNNTKFSITPEMDAEFEQAYRDGDEESARKLVEQAAKANGYNSPLLYHGTPYFGFTQIDTELSDDKKTFWATDSNDVARTYSGGVNTKSIQDRVFDGNPNVVLKNGRRWRSDEGVLRYLDRLGYEYEYDGNTVRVPDWDITPDHHWYDPRRGTEEYNEPISEVAYELSKLYGKSPLLGMGSRQKQIAGTYELYGKLDNFKTVDAGFDNWNRINYEGERATTREIAEKTVEEGYDGLVITNVNDNGGRWEDGFMHTKKVSAANVYVFFNPQEQTKSADPFTFDDDGELIPLSKRFDESNSDIRFSVDSEGNELSSEQEEFFKDSKVRDEQGNLKVMYHGTQNAGFTVFDSDLADDGLSMFFTDTKSTASSYSGSDERFKPRNFKNLDDINKFLDENYSAPWRQVSETDDGYVMNVIYKGLWEKKDETEELYAETFDELVEEMEEYGDGGTTGNYKVYLNITNPLIVDAENNYWDEIPFWNQMDEKYREELAESEMDWEIDNKPDSFPLTTRQISAYARWMGHDGVIFNNLVDNAVFAAGSDRFKSSTVVVAFNSNQIKDVDNKNPTSNPDIRYTIDDVADYIDNNSDEFPESVPIDDEQALEGQERKRDTIAELENRCAELKAEMKLTHGKVLNKRSVKGDFNELVRTLISGGYKSGRTNNDMVNGLVANASTVYRNIKNDNWDEAAEVAYYTARELVDELVIVQDEMFTQYRDLADEMRDIRIVVPQDVKDGIEEWNEFRKSQMGRLRLVNNGGVSIDVYYEELADRYPELFDKNITHPVDQLQLMADVRESMRPYDMMLSSEDAESLTKQIATDILEITSENGEAKVTWADKKKKQYDDRLKAMKVRHQEAMNKMREAERKKADERVKAERWLGNERAEAQRIRGEMEVQKAKRKAKEDKAKAKAKAVRKKNWNKITEDFKWLAGRVLEPTETKPMPEELRRPIAEMLCTIDLQSELSKKMQEKTGVVPQSQLKMEGLRAALMEFSDGDSSYSAVADEELWHMMKEFDAQVYARPIDELSDEEIDTVAAILRGIRREISNLNRAFLLSKDVHDMGEQVIWEATEHMTKHPKKWDGGHIYNLFNSSMVTPVDFFERLGAGMREAFMNLRNGDNRHMDNMADAKEFFTQLFTKYNHSRRPGSKIKKWRDPKKKQTFKVAGGEVSLTVAQMMSLYCTQKRASAMGHLLGSGIVPSDVSLKNNATALLGQKNSDRKVTKGIRLNEADIKKICDKLTDEQRKIADELQDYINTKCTNWLNETSMLMYGYNKFGEPNYFPMKSERAFLDSHFDKEANNIMESIKNFGFTKQLVENANNGIVIDDIFAVVTKHISEASLYNSFAAPIADFTRLYNYKNRDEFGRDNDSVKSALTDAFGSNVDNYIVRFMSNVQGQNRTSKNGLEGIIDTLLANSKKASIGANIRVALQQPTAIVRALALIDPKYFVKMDHTPSLMKKMSKDDMTAFEEMVKYCPVARRKSWGFSQTDLARPLEDIIMNEWSMIDTLTMEVYGALDNYTWAKIWKAVKAETRDKYPDVKYESEEFFKLCSERATEVFDKTQVVDSVFHRSDAMRSDNMAAKVATAFMAEPTRTYNMLRTDIINAWESIQEGDKKKGADIISRTLLVFTANAAACAVAQTLGDCLRNQSGDGDDEEFWLIWYANFRGNILVTNMIPILKEFGSWSEGWGASDMTFKGLADTVRCAQKIIDNLMGKNDDSLPSLILDLAKAQSSVTGIPVKNFLRDAKAIIDFMGLDAFAAEKGENGEESQNFVQQTLGSVLGKTKKSDKKDEKDQGDGKSDTVRREDIDYGIYAEDTKHGLGEKANHFIHWASQGAWGMSDESYAKEQKRKADYERVQELKALEDPDKIYKKATDNYTKIIETGDVDTIREMRKTLQQAGGDVEKFDKGVEKYAKIGLKKSLGNDYVRSTILKQFLKDNYGWTDETISRQILEKSDLAKEFQRAAAMEDHEKAQELAYQLADAGLTYDDFNWIYQHRWDAIEAEATGTYKWPVEGGRISSNFGARWGKLHGGMDIAVPSGTPVTASDGGVVTRVASDGSRGLYVDIKHPDGTYTRYQHLSSFQCEKGQKVSQGQPIALSGNTGNSTGPHLHFAVYQGAPQNGNANAIDPRKYLAM